MHNSRKKSLEMKYMHIHIWKSYTSTKTDTCMQRERERERERFERCTILMANGLRLKTMKSFSRIPEITIFHIHNFDHNMTYNI